MRQIVSLIKDDQVHYALVDEDDGSLVPFASITLPDPDRFGLHEAAVLGTNLINTLALGANGTKPSRPQAAVATEPQAPASHAHETARERKLRLDRERWHNRKDGQRKRAEPDPANKVEEYIPTQWVVNIINEYPDGITAKEIGERIWRVNLHREGLPERWCTRSVENRLSAEMIAARDGKRELPFVIERVPVLDKEGRPSKIIGRILKPLTAG